MRDFTSLKIENSKRKTKKLVIVDDLKVLLQR